MNVFVFDIETVPDVDGGRRLYDFEGLSDADVAKAMLQKRRQQTGTSDALLRLHLQRVVAISLVIRRDSESYRHFEVRTLGNPDSPERELLRQFFGGLAKYTPTLVSWNGGGFDLPVLHYRALLHGVSAPRYWETGDHDRDFRYNSYLSRYYWRHTDLMDVLAGFSPRANAPLDEIATLLGFPGKMGMDGSKVWDAFQNGDIHAIRNYCETDVLNTYLVYLRFELMRGQLDESAYQRECELIRTELARGQAERPHLGEFLRAWSRPGQNS